MLKTLRRWHGPPEHCCTSSHPSLWQSGELQSRLTIVTPLKTGGPISHTTYYSSVANNTWLDPLTSSAISAVTSSPPVSLVIVVVHRSPWSEFENRTVSPGCVLEPPPRRSSSTGPNRATRWPSVRPEHRESKLYEERQVKDAVK